MTSAPSGRRVEQGALFLDVHDGPAVFTGDGRIDLPSVAVGNVLGSVADAQHRVTALDAGEIRAGSLAVPDGPGAARENHAPDAVVEDGNPVEWMDFTVNVQLPESAADKLGDL